MEPVGLELVAEPGVVDQLEPAVEQAIVVVVDCLPSVVDRFASASGDL